MIVSEFTVSELTSIISSNNHRNVMLVNLQRLPRYASFHIFFDDPPRLDGSTVARISNTNMPTTLSIASTSGRPKSDTAPFPVFQVRALSRRRRSNRNSTSSFENARSSQRSDSKSTVRRWWRHRSRNRPRRHLAGATVGRTTDSRRRPVVIRRKSSIERHA